MATQVLPTSISHFPPAQMAYGNQMMSGFPNFEHLPAESQLYHADQATQPLLMVSPHTGTADMPYRRRSSHSPQAALRAPAMRDRTPIQHQRPDLSRGRSHSRSDMLLAYAAEQTQLHQSQSLPSMGAVPSQGGPNMAQTYSLANYNISPPLTGFAHQGGYFGSPMPPASGQLESGDFSVPQNEAEPQAFFPVGRTSSYGSAMSVPPPESPNQLHLSGPSHHGQQPLPSIGMTMQPFPPVPLTLESSPAEIEIMPSRPKPQCWDHGCNGRQFSTFSNLLRHQREKSGSATKAICPHCGTEFTRTTARNGHMSGGKCKGKPEGDAATQRKEL